MRKFLKLALVAAAAVTGVALVRSKTKPAN
jgi:hypothetical protein